MTISMKTMKHLLAALLALAIPCAALFAADEAPVQPGLANPFFAFDNGVGRDAHVPLPEQARILKELGYAGIGFTGTKRIPEMLHALDANGLKLFSIYVGASVDADKPSYEAGLETAIEQLKGRDTIVWLFVTGGTPSTDNSDGKAVATIRKIADMAKSSGLRVALYPHVGCYVARVEDAVRLAKKVGRTNVGASFNLCHFLKLDDGKNLTRRLQEAMPYLFLVSINGADGGQTNAMDWNRLIQPLDRGSFDTKGLLHTLHTLGYQGPIGLQSYNVPGDIRQNLHRSIEAWRRISGQL